jgi:DNA recombination protein RmuC
MEIILLITGIIAGLFIGYFFAKSRSGNQLPVLQEQLKQKELLYLEEQQYSASLLAEKEAFLSRALRAETQLQQAQDAVLSAKQESKQLGEQLKLEMEALAQRVAEKNTQLLSAKNEEKIGQLLNPLKEEIKEFKNKVEQTYDRESFGENE